jgi:diadenosine tetraphosphate (Ap4A) HIT family hydrolase
MTCELLHARDTGDRPLWDNIHRTAHWDVVHCNSTSLLGWMVLVVRRHIASVAELTEDEAVELGRLLRLVSIAVQQTTGCEKTYAVQFAEHPQHPHVHFHVIPVMADMPASERSVHVFKQLGVPENDRVPKDQMNALAADVRAYLRQTLQHDSINQ